MNQSIIQKTSIKKNILTGVHIECEPPGSVTRYCGSVEKEAKALESWAQEIKDFIRDHRSMDSIYLEVVREYSDLCDLCTSPWEETIDDGKICCASCGAELNDEEFIKSIKVKQGE